LLALPLLLLGGCASIVIHDRPILDRTSFEAVPAARPLAEPTALLQAGIALDKKDPIFAITYYRDAALKALPLVQTEGISPHLDLGASRPAQGLYRRAIEYMIEAAYRQAQYERIGWTDVLAQAGVSVQGRLSLYRPENWSEVHPTRRYDVKGFNHSVGQGGIGAPVVAHLTRSGKWGQPETETTGALTEPCEAHFPQSLFRAASAVIRPGDKPSGPLAVLELHDPVVEPDMVWQPGPGAPGLPLAYDMTVPLGRQFHIANLNLMAAMGVLYPSEYDGRTGLYLVDPYEPGKIPVVFVHGLMSSPEAWTNAMNDLRGDPELRKRYQFWMFFYSTGNPILASAARFRKAVNDVRAQLDPQCQDPAFDRMVLIGHSMGGLLSRLAISSSGQTLWQNACKVPPEQVEMAPALKDLLLEALFFEPVPTVSRVVFVSTPHAGSPLGDDLVGRIASRMIRVPSNIIQIRETLARYNGSSAVSEAFRGTRYATSVAQLGVGNPVLAAIQQTSLNESVPYHSIIGYNGKQPLPAGGDGVVPYTSAHIEGALSELVVTSDHSAQEREVAIQEMRRILRLHWSEYAVERREVALGHRPPVRITRPSGRTPVKFVLAPGAESAFAHQVARSDAPDAPVTR
jgi:pimeloyl-ACP methyl ester carboxylesterase